MLPINQIILVIGELNTTCLLSFTPARSVSGLSGFCLEDFSPVVNTHSSKNMLDLLMGKISVSTDADCVIFLNTSSPCLTRTEEMLARLFPLFSVMSALSLPAAPLLNASAVVFYPFVYISIRDWAITLGQN